MQRFDVKGMTCGHCVRAVTEAIKQLDDDAEVDIDLAAGKMTVVSELPASEIIKAVYNEGYEAYEAK
ncbi:heavy-metal-associated domain-containing protein [Entomomonas asaccharolytica]|uniref:Heavy-metal-associated domain-containing protein n=1 Tax=Entomomonas asaccharolytica TaxID=2785331 RepID=A0A974NHF1_9GAMM|nr:heavy metal-associated domain-containing protein [Entomomonas asaccharolytica]QQP86650.1 heavy-metal-associated domain-containing protein [Entomomonas asaccharolytica]